MKHILKTLATFSLVELIGRNPVWAGALMMMGAGSVIVSGSLNPPSITPQPSAYFSQSNQGATNIGLLTPSGAFSLPSSPQGSFAIYGEDLMNPAYANNVSGMLSSPQNTQQFGMMVSGGNGSPSLGFQAKFSSGGINFGYWWLPTGSVSFLVASSNVANPTNPFQGYYSWQASSGGCPTANGVGAREPAGVYSVNNTGGGVADPGFLCGETSTGGGASVNVSNVSGLGMSQPVLSPLTCLSNTPISGEFQVTFSVTTPHGLEAGNGGFSLNGFSVTGFNTNYMTAAGTTSTQVVGVSASTGACPAATVTTGLGTLGSGTGGSITTSALQTDPYANNVTTGIEYAPNQRACFMIGENGDDSNFPGSQFAYATDYTGTPLPGSSPAVLSPWLNMGAASFHGYMTIGPQITGTAMTFSAVGGTNALAGTTVSTLTYTNSAAPGFPSQTGYITYTLSGGTVPVGMAVGDEFTVSGIVNSPTSPNLFNGTFKMGSGSSGSTLIGVAVSGNITSPGTFSSGASAVITTSNSLSVTTNPSGGAYLYPGNTNTVLSGTGIPAGVTTVTAQSSTSGSLGLIGTYTLSNYVGIPSSETVTGTFQAGQPALTVTSMDSYNVTGATTATGQLYDVQFTIQSGNPFIVGSEFTVSGLTGGAAGFNGTYVAVAPTSDTTPGTTVYGKLLNQAVGVPATFTGSPTFSGTGSAVSVIMPGMTIQVPNGPAFVLPYGMFGGTGTGGTGTYGTTGNGTKSITGQIDASGVGGAGVLTNSTNLGITGFITVGDIVTASGYTGTVTSFLTGTGNTGTYGLSVAPGSTITTGIAVGPMGIPFATPSPVDITADSGFYHVLSANTSGPPWVKATQRSSATLGDIVNGIGLQTTPLTGVKGWQGALANVGLYQGMFPNTLGVPSSTAFNSLCQKSTDFNTFAISNSGKWLSLYRLNNPGLWEDSSVAQLTGASLSGASGTTATLTPGTITTGALTGSGTVTLAGAGIPGCPSACPTFPLGAGPTYTVTWGSSIAANVSAESMSVGHFKPLTPVAGFPLVGGISSGVLTVTSVAPAAQWSATAVTSVSTASGQAGPTLTFASPSGTLSSGNCLLDTAGLISPTAPLCTAGTTGGTTVTVNANYFPNSFTFPGCTAPPAGTGCTDTLYSYNTRIIPGQYVTGPGVTTPAEVIGQLTTAACTANPQIPAGVHGECGTYALSTTANSVSPGTSLTMSGVSVAGAIAPGAALTITNPGVNVFYPMTVGSSPMVGNIPLSGTYNSSLLGGTPSSIQAQISSTPGGPPVTGCSACAWTNLSSAIISAGAWSGTAVNIPVGSPYFISVRAGNGTSYVTLPNMTGVGLNLATTGEGNTGWLTNTNPTQSSLFGLYQANGYTGPVVNGGQAVFGPPVLNNLQANSPTQFAVDAEGTIAVGDGTSWLMQNASAILTAASGSPGPVPVSLSNMSRNGVPMSDVWWDNNPQSQTIAVGDGSSTIFSSGAGFGGTVGGNGLSNSMVTQTVQILTGGSISSATGILNLAGGAPSNSWNSLTVGDAISCTACSGGSNYSGTIVAAYPTVPSGSSTPLTGTGAGGTYQLSPAPGTTIPQLTTLTIKHNVLSFNTALAYGAGIIGTYSVVGSSPAVPTLTVSSAISGSGFIDPGETVSDGTNTSTLMGCTSGCTQSTPNGSTWALSDTHLSAGPCSGGSPCTLAVQPPGGALMPGTVSQLGLRDMGSIGYGLSGSLIKFGTFQLLVNGTVVCQDNTSVFSWQLAGAACTDVGLGVIDSANSWVNYQYGTYSFKFTSAPSASTTCTIGAHSFGAGNCYLTAHWTTCFTLNNDGANNNVCWVGNGQDQNGVLSSVAANQGGINGWVNASQTPDPGAALLIGQAKSQKYGFATNMARFINGQANMPMLSTGYTRGTGTLQLYGASLPPAFDTDSEWYFGDATNLSQFNGKISAQGGVSGAYTAILTLSGAATGTMWEGEMLDCNPDSVACSSSSLAAGQGIPVLTEIVGICTTALCGSASPSGWGTNGSTYLLANTGTVAFVNTIGSAFAMDNALYYPGAIYVGPSNDDIPQQAGGGGFEYLAGPMSGVRLGQRQGIEIAAALAGNPSLGSAPTASRALVTGCSVTATTAPCFDDGNTYAASATPTGVTGAVMTFNGLAANSRPIVPGQTVSCSGCASNLIVTSVSNPPTESTVAGQGQIGSANNGFTVTTSASSGWTTGAVTFGCKGTMGVGSNCIDIGISINTGGTYGGQAASLATCGANNVQGTNTNQTPAGTLPPWTTTSFSYLTPNGTCKPATIGAIVEGFKIGTAAIADSYLPAVTSGIFSNVGSAWSSGFDIGYYYGVEIQNEAFTCNIVAATVVQCVHGAAHNIPGQSLSNQGLSTMNGVVSGLGIWPVNTTTVSYGQSYATGVSQALIGNAGGQSFPFTPGSGYTVSTSDNGTTSSSGYTTLGGICPIQQFLGTQQMMAMGVAINGGVITDVYPANIGSQLQTQCSFPLSYQVFGTISGAPSNPVLNLSLANLLSTGTVTTSSSGLSSITISATDPGFSNLTIGSAIMAQNTPGGSLNVNVWPLIVTACPGGTCGTTGTYTVMNQNTATLSNTGWATTVTHSGGALPTQTGPLAPGVIFTDGVQPGGTHTTITPSFTGNGYTGSFPIVCGTGTCTNVGTAETITVGLQSGTGGSITTPPINPIEGVGGTSTGDSEDNKTGDLLCDNSGAVSGNPLWPLFNTGYSNGLATTMTDPGLCTKPWGMHRGYIVTGD